MNSVQSVFPSFGSFLAKRFMSQVTDKLFGRSVMFCISGGSYVRDSALELINGIGYQLHNGYGMSEIGIASVELRRKANERNENSIGRPFDSVEYKLTENNELLVKGTTLCRRKLTNGEETPIEEWFHTGDIAEEKDGNYFILGRIGDMIIGDNGENINPDSIEKFFSSSHAIAFSILGMPGENGEELSMVVQIHPYSTSEQIANITKEIYAINETLPLSCSVKKFYFTMEEMIPPTAVKVSRTQLMHKISSESVKLIPFREIGDFISVALDDTPLMQEVKGVIAKTLSISVEDIQSSSHIFYDLGATSLQYFSILVALSEHFSISQQTQNSNFLYTVEDITKYIESHL